MNYKNYFFISLGLASAMLAANLWQSSKPNYVEKASLAREPASVERFDKMQRKVHWVKISCEEDEFFSEKLKHQKHFRILLEACKEPLVFHRDASHFDVTWFEKESGWESDYIVLPSAHELEMQRNLAGQLELHLKPITQ